MEHSKNIHCTKDYNLLFPSFAHADRHIIHKILISDHDYYKIHIASIACSKILKSKVNQKIKMTNGF
jgi:hypothetical protein